MIKGNNNKNSEQSHPLWGTLYVKRTECVLEKCHDFGIIKDENKVL